MKLLLFLLFLFASSDVFANDSTLYKKRLQSIEELYTWLSLFAAEQCEQLPRHASDWERGQVDGLFWAMDKLDELVEK